jgi:two-component system, LytTR family, response regulator
MKLRALIVDDEPLARERLLGMLRNETSVDVVGECSNGLDAIATIKSTPLDLVFLDMQMPGCDGLQVLAEIPVANRPAIIFATAHEQFALDAFEVQAIDYLLKPFDRERLQTALRRTSEFHRVRQQGATPPTAESPSVPAPTPSQKNERLTVKADGRLVFLKADEIIWVEAADNYVVLHLVTGRLMLRETMAAIEARLGTVSFVRVSRSAIVHLEQIKELQPALHGDYTVLLREGTKLPLSRSLRGQLGKFVTGS